MGVADLASAALGVPAIGAVPCWTLAFQRDGRTVLSVDERDYRAEIEVALAGGIEAGATTIRLVGIVEAHAKALAGAMADGPLDLDLSLGWRSGPKAVLSAVAALRVTSADRRPEGLRWVAVIEARERAIAALSGRRVRQSLTSSSAVEAAAMLVEAQTGPRVVRHEAPNPPPTGEPPPDEEAERGVPVLEALRRLAGRMEERSGRFGRGAALVRAGVVHLGTGRPIPFGDGSAPGKPLDLSAAGTLLEIRARDPQVTDPNVDLAAEGAPDALPSRRRFELRLLGTPSVLPGDAASFHPPDEPASGAGLLGAVASAASAFVALPTDAATAAVTIYVEAVAHRLSIATGFVTTLSGVVIDGRKAEAGQWDAHTPIGAPRAPTRGPAADGTPYGAIAAAIAKVANRDDGRRPPEVAEIRAHGLPGGDGPALTSRVLDGLSGAVPGGGLALRGAIDREHPHPREAVPYLSPFALGPYGLILPRLPGMRVLLAYRGGDPTDPVDLGSFRKITDPVPKAEDGDWWLILPAEGVAGNASVADPVAMPTANASDDLTDAEGNRVIEVGSLTVRVGRAALDAPGTRPRRGADAAVTIEHADGKSKVVMNPDGTVVIEAASALTLKSGAKLTLDAPSVEVKLRSGGTMDVTEG